MKCPQCGSRNVKKVKFADPVWRAGHERCEDCAFQEVWTFFTEPSLIPGRKKVVIE